MYNIYIDTMYVLFTNKALKKSINHMRHPHSLSELRNRIILINFENIDSAWLNSWFGSNSWILWSHDMDFRYESSSFILYHEIFSRLSWTLGKMLDKLKLSDIHNISFLNLVMTHEYFLIKNMINCSRGYVNFTLSITLICYIRRWNIIKHFFKIIGNASYKPNFGSHLVASDWPSFL